MSLSVIAVALFAIGLLVARATYLVNRQPRARWWNGETATLCLLTPLILSSWVTAGGCVVLLLRKQQALGIVEGLIIAAIVAGAVALWPLLGRALRPAAPAQAATLAPGTADGPGHEPATPGAPTRPPRAV